MRLRPLLAAALLLPALAAAGCRSAGPSHEAAPAAGVARVEGLGGGTPRGLVAALRSGTFEARSRAAERLIAIGEQALPALSDAGEGRVTVVGGLSVSTTRPVVAEILAQVADDRLVKVHLAARAPVVRAAAAQELGRREGWGSVPFLIERLDDEDEAVRAAASASLRRLTNQFLGYEACAPIAERQTASTRWRSWWYREGRLSAADASHKRG